MQYQKIATLPDRPTVMPVADKHFVLGTPLRAPLAPGQAEAIFGMGCYWGVERRFWQLPGVVSTSVGFAGGATANATYRDVCSGATGHAEVVRVVYDTAKTDYEALLRQFWEGHDPTQGMRQGNDRGSQYRSAIYYVDEAQAGAGRASRDAYQERLAAAGYGQITTEIAPLEAYYYAEDDHQQYLAKNPTGYCGVSGTGVSCPVGLGAAE